MTPEAQWIGEGQGPGAQALRWLAHLKSGSATRDDLAAFGTWRAADPANEAAYRQSLATWQMLAPAIAQAAPVDEPAAPRSAMAAIDARLSRRRLLTGAGMALGVAVALPIAFGLSSVPAGATVLTTRKGERRREVLPDGVVVELNTNTRVVSWATGDVRELRLERGEALISVGEDGARRLHAAVDDTEIVADRARFLLSWFGDRSPRVLCVWGSIDVRANGQAYRLAAAQTIGADGGSIASAPPAQIDGALEWQRGVLAFENRRASDVVAELNRYRDGQVFLPGSHADVPISGVIHLDRADAAVEHIARSLGMETTRLPGGIVILRD